MSINLKTNTFPKKFDELRVNKLSFGKKILQLIRKSNHFKMPNQMNPQENEINFITNSANSLTRLVNFIIDSIIWLIIYLATAYFFDVYFVRFNSYVSNYVYSSSLAIITFLAYYVLFEFYFQRTLGKFLSGTKVIDTTGNKPTFLTILKRSISRLIPVDIFFYLFSKRGLHDRLSNTIVVKKSRLESEQ